MVEFNQLEQFVTIAKEGTISKAAEILLISQPALTRSMQRLEEDLDVKLFNRKKNKVTLNETGELALEKIIELLDHRDRTIKIIQSFENSKLCINIGSCAPAPIWALNHLFKNKYPLMNITDCINSDESKLLEGLSNHELSIIVLNHPVNNDIYECKSLFEEHLYLSVPPAHPLALFKEITFDDLNGESVLLYSKIGFWNEICIKKIPESHLLIQNDTSVFNELTKASALPNFRSNITMLREGDEKHRISIPITDSEAHTMYYAIYHKNNRQLFEFIQENIDKINWKEI